MTCLLIKTVRIAGVVVTTVLAAFSAHAEGEKVGDTQMCVPLQSISGTQVIDEKTILIEMHGRKYKRMDLVASCSGLTMGYGWVHHTHTNDICTTDTLRVNQTAGATCMIDKIVTISAEEAKELKKKK